MKKLFREIRQYLKEQEASLAEMSQEDSLIALGAMSAGLNDIIEKYQSQMQDALLNAGEEEVNFNKLPEPEEYYVPNLRLLVEAAITTLSIRGSILDQLKESDNTKYVTEVESFLKNAEKDKESKK